MGLAKDIKHKTLHMIFILNSLWQHYVINLRASKTEAVDLRTEKVAAQIILPSYQKGPQHKNRVFILLI